MRISTQNAQWLSQLGLLQHYVPPTDPMRPFDCPDELTSQISSGELFRTILLKEAERLQNQELFNKVHRISVPSTNPQATPQSTYEELFVVFSYIGITIDASIKSRLIQADEETVDRVLSYLEQVCKRLEPEPGSIPVTIPPPDPGIPPIVTQPQPPNPQSNPSFPQVDPNTVEGRMINRRIAQELQNREGAAPKQNGLSLKEARRRKLEAKAKRAEENVQQAQGSNVVDSYLHDVQRQLRDNEAANRVRQRELEQDTLSAQIMSHAQTVSAHKAAEDELRQQLQQQENEQELEALEKEKQKYIQMREQQKQQATKLKLERDRQQTEFDRQIIAKSHALLGTGSGAHEDVEAVTVAVLAQEMLMATEKAHNPSLLQKDVRQHRREQFEKEEMVRRAVKNVNFENEQEHPKPQPSQHTQSKKVMQQFVQHVAINNSLIQQHFPSVSPEHLPLGNSSSLASASIARFFRTISLSHSFNTIQQVVVMKKILESIMDHNKTVGIPILSFWQSLNVSTRDGLVRGAEQSLPTATLNTITMWTNLSRLCSLPTASEAFSFTASPMLPFSLYIYSRLNSKIQTVPNLSLDDLLVLSPNTPFTQQNHLPPKAMDILKNLVGEAFGLTESEVHDVTLDHPERLQEMLFKDDEYCRRRKYEIDSIKSYKAWEQEENENMKKNQEALNAWKEKIERERQMVLDVLQNEPVQLDNSSSLHPPQPIPSKPYKRIPFVSKFTPHLPMNHPLYSFPALSFYFFVQQHSLSLAFSLLSEPSSIMQVFTLLSAGMLSSPLHPDPSSKPDPHDDCDVYSLLLAKASCDCISTLIMFFFHLIPLKVSEEEAKSREWIVKTIQNAALNQRDSNHLTLQESNALLFNLRLVQQECWKWYLSSGYALSVRLSLAFNIPSHQHLLTMSFTSLIRSFTRRDLIDYIFNTLIASTFPTSQKQSSPTGPLFFLETLVPALTSPSFFLRKYLDELNAALVAGVVFDGEVMDNVVISEDRIRKRVEETTVDTVHQSLPLVPHPTKPVNEPAPAQPPPVARSLPPQRPRLNHNRSKAKMPPSLMRTIDAPEVEIVVNDQDGYDPVTGRRIKRDNVQIIQHKAKIYKPGVSSYARTAAPKPLPQQVAQSVPQPPTSGNKMETDYLRERNEAVQRFDHERRGYLTKMVQDRQKEEELILTIIEPISHNTIDQAGANLAVVLEEFEDADLEEDDPIYSSSIALPQILHQFSFVLRLYQHFPGFFLAGISANSLKQQSFFNTLYSFMIRVPIQEIWCFLFQRLVSLYHGIALSETEEEKHILKKEEGRSSLFLAQSFVLAFIAKVVEKTEFQGFVSAPNAESLIPTTLIDYSQFVDDDCPEESDLFLTPHSEMFSPVHRPFKSLRLRPSFSILFNVIYSFHPSNSCLKPELFLESQLPPKSNDIFSSIFSSLPPSVSAPQTLILKNIKVFPLVQIGFVRSCLNQVIQAVSTKFRSQEDLLSPSFFFCIASLSALMAHPCTTKTEAILLIRSTSSILISQALQVQPTNRHGRGSVQKGYMQSSLEAIEMIRQRSMVHSEIKSSQPHPKSKNVKSLSDYLPQSFWDSVSHTVDDIPELKGVRIDQSLLEEILVSDQNPTIAQFLILRFLGHVISAMMLRYHDFGKEGENMERSERFIRKVKSLELDQQTKEETPLSRAAIEQKALSNETVPLATVVRSLVSHLLCSLFWAPGGEEFARALLDHERASNMSTLMNEEIHEMMMGRMERMAERERLIVAEEKQRRENEERQRMERMKQRRLDREIEIEKRVSLERERQRQLDQLLWEEEERIKTDARQQERQKEKEERLARRAAIDHRLNEEMEERVRLEKKRRIFEEEEKVRLEKERKEEEKRRQEAEDKRKKEQARKEEEILFSQTDGGIAEEDLRRQYMMYKALEKQLEDMKKEQEALKQELKEGDDDESEEHKKKEEELQKKEHEQAELLKRLENIKLARRRKHKEEAMKSQIAEQMRLNQTEQAEFEELEGKFDFPRPNIEFPLPLVDQQPDPVKPNPLLHKSDQNKLGSISLPQDGQINPNTIFSSRRKLPKAQSTIPAPPTKLPSTATPNAPQSDFWIPSLTQKVIVDTIITICTQTVSDSLLNASNIKLTEETEAELRTALDSNSPIQLPTSVLVHLSSVSVTGLLHLLQLQNQDMSDGDDNGQLDEESEYTDAEESFEEEISEDEPIVISSEFIQDVPRSSPHVTIVDANPEPAQSPVMPNLTEPEPVTQPITAPLSGEDHFQDPVSEAVIEDSEIISDDEIIPEIEMDFQEEAIDPYLDQNEAPEPLHPDPVHQLALSQNENPQDVSSRPTPNPATRFPPPQKKFVARAQLGMTAAQLGERPHFLLGHSTASAVPQQQVHVPHPPPAPAPKTQSTPPSIRQSVEERNALRQQRRDQQKERRERRQAEAQRKREEKLENNRQRREEEERLRSDAQRQQEIREQQVVYEQLLQQQQAHSEQLAEQQVVPPQPQFRRVHRLVRRTRIVRKKKPSSYSGSGAASAFTEHYTTIPLPCLNFSPPKFSRNTVDENSLKLLLVYLTGRVTHYFQRMSSYKPEPKDRFLQSCAERVLFGSDSSSFIVPAPILDLDPISSAYVDSRLPVAPATSHRRRKPLYLKFWNNQLGIFTQSIRSQTTLFFYPLSIKLNSQRQSHKPEKWQPNPSPPRVEVTRAHPHSASTDQRPLPPLEGQPPPRFSNAPKPKWVNHIQKGTKQVGAGRLNPLKKPRQTSAPSMQLGASVASPKDAEKLKIEQLREERRKRAQEEGEKRKQNKEMERQKILDAQNKLWQIRHGTNPERENEKLKDLQRTKEIDERINRRAEAQARLSNSNGTSPNEDEQPPQEVPSLPPPQTTTEPEPPNNPAPLSFQPVHFDGSSLWLKMAGIDVGDILSNQNQQPQTIQLPTAVDLDQGQLQSSQITSPQVLSIDPTQFQENNCFPLPGSLNDSLNQTN